jgi:imidazolonepropionase
VPEWLPMDSFVLAPIGELCLPVHPGRVGGGEMQKIQRIHNAGVVIEKGLIAFIGSSEDAISRRGAPAVIGAGGLLATPGLVDCHTHLVWAGNRSAEFIRRCKGETYEQIAQSGGGILSSIEQTRKATIDELADGIAKRCELIATLGTTTIEIKASYAFDAANAKKELDSIESAKSRVKQRIVTTYMGAHAMPVGTLRSEYIGLLKSELIPGATGRARFNDVFCEEGAFSVQESKDVLECGLAHGLRPKIHSDEFNALGGTEIAVSLGAVSCDHLLAASDSGIAALASSETVAVLMPGTSFYLGKPYAKARKLIDEGCAVALGSDFNPGSSQVPSMAFAMGLAVAKMGMTPEEALSAATVNAAAAIEEPCGSLAIGERADICVWPCATLEELVYEFAFVRPTMVFARGNQIV